MVTKNKISFLIIIILSINGCQNTEQKSFNKIEEDFGLQKNKNDSIAVELKFAQFNNWLELLERTYQIVCHDSIPKITFENDSIIKRIYLNNQCWDGMENITTKPKNIIEIHNDTVIKSNENFYPLDSLSAILRRDIENNRKNSKLSESPEMLLIYISYDKNGISKLPNTLNQLTIAIKKVTTRKDLKIWLKEKIYIPPPPNLLKN